MNSMRVLAVGLALVWSSMAISLAEADNRVGGEQQAIESDVPLIASLAARHAGPVEASEVIASPASVLTMGGSPGNGTSVSRSAFKSLAVPSLPGEKEGRSVPANDNCEDATEVVLSSGSVVVVNGNNTGATSQCPLIGGATGFREVWFKVVLEERADLTIDLCGTMPAFMLFHPLLLTTCPCSMPLVGADATDMMACGDMNVTLKWDMLDSGTYYYPLLTDSMMFLNEGPYTIRFSAVGLPGTVCPEESLMSQPVEVADPDYGAYISGILRGIEITAFEKINTTEFVNGLHWWGLRAFYDAGNGFFVPCNDPTPFEFEITFYENGLDGLAGDPVASFTVYPTVTDLGSYSALSNLMRYSVEDLTPCPMVLDGWVSVKALQHPSGCNFGWLRSEFGEGLAYATQAGNTVPFDDNLSLCLTSSGCPAATGACCLDWEPSCTEGLEAAECVALGGRFLPNADCDEMQPLCGEVVGACCHPDATCTITTLFECADNWLGADTICDQCPCLVPCPAGSLSEPEVCGERINNGCSMDVPAFTPIACGDMICGTTWSDNAERDTDWYRIVTDEWLSFTWTVEGEVPMAVGVLQVGPNGCDDSINIGTTSANECADAMIATGTWPPGEYWFVLSPAYWDDWPCEKDYVATLTCEPGEPGHCPAFAHCGFGWIERVQVGGIDNPTSCLPYNDFSDLSTDVVVGDSALLVVATAQFESAMRNSVWVDWNQDLVFDDSELIGSHVGSGTFGFDITPPLTALLGPTRMRICLDTATVPQPCGERPAGEVEDYTLNVVEMPGVCCLPDGSCQVLLPSECTGAYVGPFTVCANEDCNGNGTDDFCDIANGFSHDCNENGVPDECDIANCPSGDLSCADCQGNGVPDGCELGEAGASAYQVDDGSSEDSIGLTAGGYWGWFNHFVTTSGAETITKVEVAYGPAPDGAPVMIYVWSDPNQDGNPADAQVLTSVESAVAFAETDTFVSVAIPPTEIGPAGTQFFVGAIIEHVAGDHPAMLDTSLSAQRSWVIGSPSTPIDPNDLDSYVLRTIDSLGYPGNWLIRADIDRGNDCNSNGIPDECDRDCNGNNTPDDCEGLNCGDLNFDGAVDYDDYAIFLTAMGGIVDGTPAQDACCDFDNSGAVGLADYNAWLECYRDFIGDPFSGPPSAPGTPQPGLNGQGGLKKKSLPAAGAAGATTELPAAAGNAPKNGVITKLSR